MSVCKYLDIQPDKAGRYVHRKDVAYECLAPDPELPPMAACISKIKLGRGYAWKELCTECPVREER